MLHGRGGGDCESRVVATVNCFEVWSLLDEVRSFFHEREVDAGVGQKQWLLVRVRRQFRLGERTLLSSNLLRLLGLWDHQRRIFLLFLLFGMWWTSRQGYIPAQRRTRNASSVRKGVAGDLGACLLDKSDWFFEVQVCSGLAFI